MGGLKFPIPRLTLTPGSDMGTTHAVAGNLMPLFLDSKGLSLFALFTNCLPLKCFVQLFFFFHSLCPVCLCPCDHFKLITLSEDDKF